MKAQRELSKSLIKASLKDKVHDRPFTSSYPESTPHTYQQHHTSLKLLLRSSVFQKSDDKVLQNSRAGGMHPEFLSATVPTFPIIYQKEKREKKNRSTFRFSFIAWNLSFQLANDPSSRMKRILELLWRLILNVVYLRLSSLPIPAHLLQKK